MIKCHKPKKKGQYDKVKLGEHEDLSVEVMCDMSHK